MECYKEYMLMVVFMIFKKCN